MNIEEKIQKLRLLKRTYDFAYWRDTNKIVNDEIYDQIKLEFDTLLKQYPQYKLETDSNLESIYMNSFTAVKHKYRMTSLGKIFSEQELINWLNK